MINSLPLFINYYGGALELGTVLYTSSGHQCKTMVRV